jgi:hypothetical protein
MSFELLGIDLLLDADLKVWLLEINITPGMYPSSDLDAFVKNPVALDMYNIVRLVDYTVENSAACAEFARIERVIRRSVRSARRDEVTRGAVNPWDDPVFLDHMIVREFVDEQRRRRRFHRAYPKRSTIDRYEKCFDRLVYEDIVLNTWVRMGQRERVAALHKNFESHRVEMGRTFPAPSKPSDQASTCTVT